VTGGPARVTGGPSGREHPGRDPGPAHRLPERLLRDWRTRCCLTSLASGGAGCGSGSGRPLVSLRRTPDPLAEPWPPPALVPGLPVPPAGLPDGAGPPDAGALPAGAALPDAGPPWAGALPGGTTLPGPTAR